MAGLETFPPQQYPIAGGNPATPDYYRYLKALDTLLRGANTPLTKAAADALYEALGQIQINVRNASYILVLADKGKTIEMTVAGANSLTIPPHSSVPLPVGTYVNVTQMGAGQTTIVGGAGVAVQGHSGLKMAGQFAMATMYQRVVDNWIVGGALTP